MNILDAVAEQVNNGDNIYVGVSGGADSMVLLHALLAAARMKDFSLHVVHIEHGIRGRESLNDANFVQNFCEKQGVDFIIRHIDVPSLCQTNKQTIEEAARQARYNVFNGLIAGGGRLFLAHNASDQAETVLMHIFRGSGIDGSVGMQINMGNICRPLLPFTKKQILEFAAESNIKFVEDATNQDNNYARNYIRNQILPSLEKMYPKVEQNINKFATFCGQAKDVVQACIKPEWLQETGSGVLLAGEAFKASRMIVASCIKAAYNKCGQYSDLTSTNIALVQDLYFNKSAGSMLNLAHGVVCEKRNEGVLFSATGGTISSQCDLALGPTTLPNGQVIDIELVSKPKFGDGNFYIDWQKVPAGSRWRTRRNGDIFAKLGSGNKKLNDYFTDIKEPNLNRDNIMLLAIGNKILCVLGKEVSETVKVDKSTKQIAKISITKG